MTENCDMPLCLRYARITCCFSLLFWAGVGGQHSKIRSLWVGTSLWLEMRQRWELAEMLKTSIEVLLWLTLPCVWKCMITSCIHDLMSVDKVLKTWQSQVKPWTCGEKSPNHVASQSIGASLLCSYGNKAALEGSRLELTCGFMAVLRQGTSIMFAFAASAYEPKDH